MDSQTRCPRCLKDDLYMTYHDTERGRPVHDETKHFEFLLLETFQAGLSRYTILARRENFRKAFANFDPQKISQFDAKTVDDLVLDAGIIRHRGKIEAAVTNAQTFLDIQKECGSRDAYIRAFTDGKTIDNQLDHYKNAPATTALSETIAKHLRKRGMKFIGPTVIYAHLQATGQVNDHQLDCRVRQDLKK